jgi:3-methyladenine DNA glycosylase AlkD
MSHDELVTRLVATFEAARDDARATAMAAYMRDQFPFLGILTPQRRALTRTIIATERDWTTSRLHAVARTCWQRDEREYQYFACDLLARHAKHQPSQLLATLEHLITTKSWWDTVDALATSVGVLVRQHPHLTATMDQWIDHDDLWLRRVAIIHQLRFRQATDAGRLFDHCLRRSHETEFFIRKAIGWALREHSKTDPDAVRTFVREHEHELSPLSRREALKWLARRNP